MSVAAPDDEFWRALCAWPGQECDLDVLAEAAAVERELAPVCVEGAVSGAEGEAGVGLPDGSNPRYGVGSGRVRSGLRGSA